MSKHPFPHSVAQLLWFVRVVEAGSFAKAARQAGVSTSALSKAVTRFEQAHGIRLLYRSTHALSLTVEGDRLLAEGRVLLREMESIENALADMGRGGEAGRVRLTAPASFGRRHLVPLLPDFLRAYPDLQFELHLSDGVVDLAAHGVDIAIRIGNLDQLPGHVSRKLSSFPWIVCASPDYLRGKTLPKTLSDLENHRLIGFRNHSTGQIDNWHLKDPHTKKAVRYVPQTTYVFDDGDAAWEMVRRGLGIGWAPSWLALNDFRNGMAVELLKDWRAEQTLLSMVRLKTRLTPKRTRIVMNLVDQLPAIWDLNVAPR